MKIDVDKFNRTFLAECVRLGLYAVEYHDGKPMYSRTLKEISESDCEAIAKILPPPKHGQAVDIPALIREFV